VILLLLCLIALIIYCVYTQLQEHQLQEMTQQTPIPTQELIVNETIENDQALDEKELQENIEKNIEENFENQEQLKSEMIEQLPIVPEKSELLQEQIDAVLKDNPIMFQRMSYEITPKSQTALKQIAQLLQENETMQVEIGGHTDAKGDDAFNMMISQKRALSVKEKLIEMGINEEYINAVGYGETRPMVENDENGYSLANRRVEIKIIKEEL
jgi:outer membrane protein OmpA-like peptidoglycan-associated protein